MSRITTAQLVSCFRTEADRIAALNEQSAPYRARNYRLAAEKIEQCMSHATRVTHAVLAKCGLTPFMYDKAVSYMSVTPAPKTTSANKPAAQKATKTEIVEQFAAISGIGPKKAAALYAAGHRTTTDLLSDPNLPIEARMFLELKPVTRIPRAYISQIERKINVCCAQYNHTHPHTPVQMLITGSYRRQKKFSGDIDICYTASESQGIDLALMIIRQCFAAENIRVYSQGPNKCSIILVGHKMNVKIDIWHVTPDHSAAMILYSTGSKEHNILMRQRAKSMGLLLNQEGLFRAGKRLPLKTERDYFDALQMKYKEPHER